MSNELTVLENHLKPLAPRFGAVLGHVMEPAHLIQTMLVACERNPKLLACSKQSLINGAMTFAALRLPVDGVTGQGFLIPFKGVAQPVIGYKGFNTLGARGGLTITGGIVREGDEEWDFREGTGGYVHHKKRLDNPGRIIAAWAAAESKTRPPAVSVLGIGELLEIKSRSPAVKGGAQTPWNDDKVGAPAMMEKTAKRRLSRVLPFEIDEGRFLRAARMDEAHDEQGLYSRIDEDGTVITEGESPIASRIEGTPSMEAMTGAKVDPEMERLRGIGMDAAEGGLAVLQKWWTRLSPREQAAMKDFKDELKAIAERADKEAGL